MKKDTFISKLKEGLTELNQEEIDEVVSDYEEHFREGIEAGKSESELTKSLGNPEKIVKQYLKEVKVQKAITVASEKPSANNIWQAILATAALGIFNLIFVIGPFFGMVGVLISFIAVAVSLVASGIAVFVGSLIAPFTDLFIMDVHPLVGIFTGISITSFGLLFAIITYYICILSYKLTVAYLKFNINLVKNK